jgi:ABC-type antimicrobial peptide transport system ATPase subunit
MSAYPHDQEVLTSGEFKIVGKEVVNLSQKARRVAQQRMRIADVQKLSSGTRGKTDLLAREQEALKTVLEQPDRELFTIIDVEQVSV